MPYKIPYQHQYPWGEEGLSKHLAQFFDPATGGLRMWVGRPTTNQLGETLSALDKGYTGYNTEDQELLRWNGLDWDVISSGDLDPEITHKWTTEYRPDEPEEGLVGFNTDTQEFELWDGEEWIFYPTVGDTELPSWTNSGRPENPEEGLIGYNTEEKDIEIWDGSKWKPVDPMADSRRWDIVTTSETLTTYKKYLVNPTTGAINVRLPFPPIDQGGYLEIFTGPNTDNTNLINVLGNGSDIDGSNETLELNRRNTIHVFVYVNGYGWNHIPKSGITTSDDIPNEGFPIFSAPERDRIKHSRGAISMPNGDTLFVERGIITIPNSFRGTTNNKLVINNLSQIRPFSEDYKVPETDLLLLRFNSDGGGNIAINAVAPERGSITLSGTEFTVSAEGEYTVSPKLSRLGGVEGEIEFEILVEYTGLRTDVIDTSPIAIKFEEEETQKSFSVNITPKDDYYGLEEFTVKIAGLEEELKGEIQEAIVKIQGKGQGPAGIPETDLWFWGDTHDVSTLALSSNRVNSWRSRIGNVSFFPYDLEPNSRPEYRSTGGVKGGPGIYFPGGSSFENLDSNQTLDANNMTMFLAFKATGEANEHRYIVGRGATTRYSLKEGSNLAVMIDDRFMDRTIRISMPQGQPDEDDFRDRSYGPNGIGWDQDSVAIFQRSPSEIKVIDNQNYTDLSEDTTIDPLNSPQILRLGCSSSRTNPTANYNYQYKGYISEVIIYTRILDEGEMQAVGEYLKNKYGI